jgi:hypothetical protein
MDTIIQERLWVWGAFGTIVMIVSACLAGSVFSEIKSEAIFAFGGLTFAKVVNTVTNKLAAIKADDYA